MIHSLLSPSSAHRWMVCPGSAALCRNIPPEESEYAAEGTAAHALAESILRGTDYTLPQEYDTPEMRAHVQTYVDFVRIIGGVLEVETRIDLYPELGEECYGTADAVAWADDGLYIVDLKYGMGFVDAVRNPQLALYAAGFLRLYSQMDTIEKLHLCIVQPRIGNISQWDVTPGEITEYAALIRKKADIARTMASLPESEWLFMPEESACKYCRARGVCRRLCDAATFYADCDAPVTLSPDALSWAYTRIGLARIWADAVEKAVYGRLLHGEGVPGLKLVEGRKGIRKWRSDADALRAIKAAGITEDVFERKLFSPAKMEKLLKDEKITKEQWGALAPEITQENTKPVIADESDKRPEYRPQELTYPNMENHENG